MNRTYVNLAKQEASKYTFGYYYGASNEWPTASYETIRRGDRGDVPSYQVAALWSDGSLNNPWTPIRSLAPEPGSSTTLMIIVSQKINYMEKSLDPIFPAEDTTRFQGDPRTYYINLSGPGTVLGCLDRTEWRDPSFGMSWLPLSQLPTKKMHDSQNARALYLLINSLAGSHIYGSMNLRLAAALDAQSRISGFVSLPLATEQWKTEIQQLFNASLARIMINARDISRGAKSEYYGFKKLPKSEVDICYETYLVQTNGWTNINFTGMMWVLCVCVFVILLAVPFTEQDSNGVDHDVLFVEYIWRWLKFVSSWMGEAMDYLWNSSIQMWQQFRPQLPSWSDVKNAISNLFPCC